MLPAAPCDQKSREKLGQDGLAEAMAWLWPRNCQFTSTGMVPPGPNLRVYRPLNGPTAWLANDFVSVSINDTIYETSAPPEVIARAKELRLVIVMVTHALDQAELTAPMMLDVLAPGDVIGGSITATWD